MALIQREIRTMALGWILFLTAAMGLAGCEKPAEGAPPSPRDEGPVSVGTYKVGEQTLHRRIDIPADVQPKKQVTILSKVPGEVKKVFVEEGDKVKAGDTLVKLDQRDFRLAVRQAKAQLAAAKAGVSAAEIGLDTVNAKHGRLAQLRDKQVISESAFEDIEGTQKSTKAQVSMAEAQVQLAQVGLESARANLSYSEIKAPFDSEVAKRMVDEGARLNAMPPTPVAVLMDDSELKVVGALSERDLPFIEAGAPVQVTVEALNGAPIDATVDRVDPIVDPVSRTAGVQVVLKNDTGSLQPGMSAELSLDLGTRQAVVVPDDVVIHSEVDSENGYVFVVKNNIASRREVRLGTREGDMREILDGLKAGDIVVRGGQAKLENGQAVVVEGTEDKKQ